jgi:hypothetical protein
MKPTEKFLKEMNDNLDNQLEFTELKSCDLLQPITD